MMNQTNENKMAEEKKIGLIHTINFQVVAINVLMLVAFVAVMAFVIMAMRNSNDKSKESSDYVLNLSTTEAA